MPQPATTSELLLAQAVDLLTEVRDLLRDSRAHDQNRPALGVATESPAAPSKPTPAAAPSRPQAQRRRSSTSGKN